MDTTFHNCVWLTLLKTITYVWHKSNENPSITIIFFKTLKFLHFLHIFTLSLLSNVISYWHRSGAIAESAVISMITQVQIESWNWGKKKTQHQLLNMEFAELTVQLKFCFRENEERFVQREHSQGVANMWKHLCVPVMSLPSQASKKLQNSLHTLKHRSKQLQI